MNASIFWPLTRNDGQSVYVGADLGVRPRRLPEEESLRILPWA